ncbi:MAG TPA: mechanosensitive ion channel family protein [Flavipsychrobacter sp.]|nr:mechanosensitive ion channel family protein [Flavipsychrobacter sp.]
MQSFFAQSYLGNSVEQWLIALGILILCVIAIKVIKYIVIRNSKRLAAKTKTDIDDFVILIIEKSVVPLLYISSIFFALSSLALSAKANRILYVATLFAGTFFILRILTAAIRRFIFSFIKKRENGEAKQKQAQGLLIIINIVIWVLGCTFLIDNLGYNVTTLIAGLGIGGIAVALAAQTILGDLFSYFAIFFDRPFEIGDFIVVDDKMGTVEYIGIKTTRVNALGGEQLVFANTDLTKARLQNYKRMEQRRVVFQLRIFYNTPKEKVESVPAMVKKIIESKRPTRLDRGHLSALADYSYTFEFVYYVLSADYNVYMDIQQSIYFDIIAAFEKEGIEFAYPTQSVSIQSSQAERTSSGL